MNIFELFIVKNLDFFLAVCGMLFVLIFSKRISKKSANLFLLIMGLCLLLTISEYFESYLGNLGNNAEDVLIYKKYGGDTMRTTLSILNYFIRPAIILLFIRITTKSKWILFLWILVGLTIPIYTTAYYSELSFNIIDNTFYGGTISLFRYYSPIICFVLIIYYIVFEIFGEKYNSTRDIVFNIFIGIFAIITSIIEMKVGGNMLPTIIIISLILRFIFVYENVVNENEKELIRINNTDILTNLGNERAYYEYLDEIDKRKDSQVINYAVALMDLNGLKVTNDAYGHRFGCQLIVEFGHQLADFFKTSRLYHTGGDEFVAIIEGDDYINRQKLLADFTEKYSCQEIIYEDKKLILSVAIGIKESEKGKKYNSIYQIADDEMYKNKKIIKQKYDIKSRLEE